MRTRWNRVHLGFVCCFVFQGLLGVVSSNAASQVDLIADAAKALKQGEESSLVVLYPEGSLDNLKPIAKVFTEKTGVEISFLQARVEDITTKILLSTAQDISDFDVALPATFGIPSLVESNALFDVSDFAAKYEPKIGYQPSLYDLGNSYKGKQYGYQTDGDAYLMFYHRDWLENGDYQKRFEAAHQRPLALPNTWQELDQLMAFFHSPEEDRYGGCMFRTPRYMVWEWWIRFHANGGLPVDDHMRPQIASEKGISALEAMLAATQHQHPSVSVNGLFENWAQYSKGQCFANIGWGGSQKYFNKDSSSMKGKMLFAPTPQFSHFNWGWSYVVARHTTQPELAYLFTLFANTPKASTLAIREDGYFDPFREEHYEDEAIEAVYTAPFLKAHRTTMLNAAPDFYLEGQSRYMQVLQEAIVSAYDGDLTPRQALTHAARGWEEITEEIGRASQQEQWQNVKASYPKAGTNLQ